MSLKGILCYIKNKFNPQDKDKIEDPRHFRLRHVFGYRDKKTDCISITNSRFDEFKFPPFMSYDDAFKVLSFLTDKVSRDYKLKHHNLESIKLTNEVLEQFHFKKAKHPVHKDDIVDLYIETGNAPDHGKDMIYFDECEWYKQYVKQEDVQEIYDGIGLQVDFSKFDENLRKTAKGPKYQQITVNPAHKHKTM